MPGLCLSHVWVYTETVYLFTHNAKTEMKLVYVRNLKFKSTVFDYQVGQNKIFIQFRGNISSSPFFLAEARW